jgi:hypothetical protein
MNALTQPKLSLEAYLAWEEDQAEKHEFYRGEVFAMVGARRVHGRVVGNLVREFGTSLKGSPCQVFHEGMKVQIGDDTVLYPDVFVTCDEADLATDRIFTAPTLVVEVAVAQHPGLRPQPEIRPLPPHSGAAGIHPGRPRHAPRGRFPPRFRRLWVLHDMSDGDTLEAACLGLRVPLAEVFAGIEPPPQTEVA